MQILEGEPQVVASPGVAANALLKVARRRGSDCRINVRATVRDLADAVAAGCTVLIHGHGTRDVYVVTAVGKEGVTLADARTGEELLLGVPAFGLFWHGNREDRTGRMMTVMTGGL